MTSQELRIAAQMECVLTPGYRRAIGSAILVILLLAPLLRPPKVSGLEDGRQMVWGANTVVLKPPWSVSPSLEGLLVDQQHTVSLGRFYRDGGQNIPATPTECRLACSSDALLVVFRCTENNLSFPAAPRCPTRLAGRDGRDRGQVRTHRAGTDLSRVRHGLQFRFGPRVAARCDPPATNAMRERRRWREP